MSKLDKLLPFYNEVKDTFFCNKDVEVTFRTDGLVERLLSRNDLRLIMYSIKNEKEETRYIVATFKGEKIFDEVVSKSELDDWLAENYQEKITTEIPFRYRIWEIEYKIEDRGHKIVVTIPCEKPDGLGGTTLSSYKKYVVDPFKMELVRRCARSGKVELMIKGSYSYATLFEVVHGYYDNGWTLDDFEEIDQ